MKLYKNVEEVAHAAKRYYFRNYFENTLEYFYTDDIEDSDDQFTGFSPKDKLSAIKAAEAINAEISDYLDDGRIIEETKNELTCVVMRLFNETIQQEKVETALAEALIRLDIQNYEDFDKTETIVSGLLYELGRMRWSTNKAIDTFYFHLRIHPEFGSLNPRTDEEMYQYIMEMSPDERVDYEEWLNEHGFDFMGTPLSESHYYDN